MRDEHAQGIVSRARTSLRESLVWLFAGSLLFGAAHYQALADGPGETDLTPGFSSYISETTSPATGPDTLSTPSSLSALSQLLASQNGTPLELGLNMAQGGGLAASNSTLSNPGVSFLFYAPSATDSAGNPLVNAAVPTTYGLSENLALTKPGKQDAKTGDTGLLLNGLFYMSNGSHALSGGTGQLLSPEEALSQDVSYKTRGLSFGLNYLDVGKAFAGDDALKAMAGQSGASATAAVNSLLSHKGQSDWDLNLGFANTNGIKAGFIMDNLTNQNNGTGARTETFSFEDDLPTGLGFSASHVVLDTTPLLGGAASTNTTDHFHLALAPIRTGFSLTADQTMVQANTGTDSNQTALNLLDKYRTFNLAGTLNLNDTSGLSPDHTSTEHLEFDNTLTKTVSFTASWNGASDLMNHGADKNDFDSVLKAKLDNSIQTTTEFLSKFEGCNQIQSLSSTIQLPRFVGTNNATWKLALSRQTIPTGQSMQTASAAVDTTLPPTKVKLPPTLPGASLHLEYAGNIIGADPETDTPITHQSSRALRIVSGPVRGNWLSWSIYEQMNPSTSGVTLPSVRDYMAQLGLPLGGSLTYTNNDQLPQSNSIAKDLKEQEIKVAMPVRKKNPLQLTADYMQGVDRADCLATTQSVSVGVAGTVTPKQTLDLSIGRTQQTGLDGGFANGTTYKVAYKWDQDSSHMLNLGSSVTCWDSGGSRLMPFPVDATARLDFKTTY